MHKTVTEEYQFSLGVCVCVCDMSRCVTVHRTPFHTEELSGLVEANPLKRVGDPQSCSGVLQSVAFYIFLKSILYLYFLKKLYQT